MTSYERRAMTLNIGCVVTLAASVLTYVFLDINAQLAVAVVYIVWIAGWVMSEDAEVEGVDDAD